MGTPLQEAMTAGVLVEFFDTCGNTVAQAVFTQWQGRPLPAVGDTLCCPAALRGSGQTEKLFGRVRARKFEVQREDDGEVSVWCRLDLETLRPDAARTRAGRQREFFSAN